MIWVWTTAGAIGLFAALLALSLALVVWRAGAGHAVDRRLVGILLAESAAVGTGFGLTLLVADAQSALLWYRVHAVSVVVFPAVYLNFIATFDSPLARPLRPRAVRAAILVIAGALAALVVARPDSLVLAMHPSATLTWEAELSPFAPLVFLVNFLVPVFGFVVAIHAWRRGPPASAARERGRALALAFGTRDVLFAACIAAIGARGAAQALGQALLPVAAILYVSLLTYGILRAQVFDIDLRMRRTLQRSILAAAFFLVFFVASELAESALRARTGSTAVGAGAALVLALGFKPIERAAGRVAAAAMPDVADRAHLDAGRARVYRAALEGSWEDGVVTDREAAILARLRAELDIPEDIATRIEREVAQIRARAPAAPAPG